MCGQCRAPVWPSPCVPPRGSGIGLALPAAVHILTLQLQGPERLSLVYTYGWCLHPKPKSPDPQWKAQAAGKTQRQLSLPSQPQLTFVWFLFTFWPTPQQCLINFSSGLLLLFVWESVLTGAFLLRTTTFQLTRNRSFLQCVCVCSWHGKLQGTGHLEEAENWI